MSGRGAGCEASFRAPTFPPLPSPARRRRLLAAALLPAAPCTSASWGPLRGGGRQWVVALAAAPPALAAVAGLEAALAGCGGHLGSFLPDAAFIAVGAAECEARLRRVVGVAAVARLPAAAKGAAAFPSPTPPHNGTHALLAAIFPRIGRGAGGASDDGGYDPAGAAAADWGAPLAALSRSAALDRAGRHILHVLVPTHEVASVASWLAAQPAIHWVAPAATAATPFNWHAGAIIQSGKAGRDPPSTRAAIMADSAHPLWAAGVDGRSQVVGGGDSGLDAAHCFFADPAVPLEFKAGANGGKVFDSTTHRKLRLYRAGPDGPSDGNGHGTHTMGSVCGTPPAGDGGAKATAYGGMAPAAKLAFTDLASGGGRRGLGGAPPRGSGAIVVPGDIGADYYRAAYDVGARVHSDSWGSPTTDYDYMASEVDAFTFKRQDFLPFFAAGNEGAVSASPTRGVTTVTAPATSKNCVAVGASQSAYARGAGGPGSAFSLHKITVAQAPPGGGPPADVESFRVVQAQFGGKLSSLYGRRLPLAAADPPDACSPLTNAGAAVGAVVVAARGACAFAAKAGSAQAAGAAALVVYDDRIADFFIPAADGGGGGGGLTLPAAAAPRRVGQLLASAAAASANVTASFGPPPAAGDAWDSLADFSSKGPTRDGRVKPDLVAPGVLQSAAAAGTDGAVGQCGTRTMQGTSMATPVAAGAGALVRDYFSRGYYPSGAPTPAAGFEPGGALVKAVLVAGAAPLDGFEVDTGLPLAPPPSFRQGFGRVHLGRSLPLAGGKDGWNLQVVDRQPASGGDVFRYCLRSTGGPLTVALAWHDAPGSPTSAKALVNDLDLTVRAAGLGGLALLGNGGGVGPRSPDRVNNVETVAVAYLPPGDVSIEVRASSVPRGPQPFALAALGAFAGVLASEFNPAAKGAPPADGRCDVVVAAVRKGPAGVLASRSVSFEFGAGAGGGETRAGAGAGPAFECALSLTNARDAPSFKACSSPASFTDLADGSYTFRVRAQGEAGAAARTFTVDATPPTLAWAGSGSAGGAFPAAAGAPASSTLAFAAADASPVTYHCRLDRDGDGPPPPTLRLWSAAPGGLARARPAAVGAWANCSSPAAYAWLPPGTWRARVAATDAAGNRASEELSARWSVDAPPARAAFLVAGPFGPGNATNAEFEVRIVGTDGKVAPATAGDGLQCQLVPVAGAGAPAAGAQPARAAGAQDAAWTACGGGASGKAAYDKLADGAYQFAARVTGSGGGTAAAGRRLAAAAADGAFLAFSDFAVRTALPAVNLTSTPPAVIANGSSVRVEWGVGGGASTACALASSANRTRAAPFPCTSPLDLASLPDGNYTLTVTATDAVGNAGAPATAAWVVDSLPPSLAPPLATPNATRTGALNFTFAATDRGSGVAGTTCRLRLVAPRGGVAASGTAPAGTWEPCTSPSSHTDLPDGRYGFAVRAADGAGNEAESGEVAAWASTVAPAGAAVTASPGSTPAPSRVTLAFQAPPDPAAAPVVRWECALVKGEGGGAGPPAPPPSPSLASPATKWEPCQSPRVYRGLASGSYSFAARPTDAAGNVGAATAATAFVVDASLPLPPEVDTGDGAGGGLTGWRLWAAVGGGAAGAVVVAVVLCACCRPAARAHTPLAFHGGPVAHRPPTGTTDAEAAALRAALAASAADADAGRRAQAAAAAAAAAREAADLRRAVDASLEEDRVREALRRSMVEK